MKKYIPYFLSLVMLVTGLVAGFTLMSTSSPSIYAPEANDLPAVYPTVSRITSTTALDYVTLEDTASASADQRAGVVQKVNIRIQTYGTGTSAKFAIVEAGSGRLITPLLSLTSVRIAPYGMAYSNANKAAALMSSAYNQSP